MVRALTKREQQAVDQLRAAFADTSHDLWNGPHLNGAEARTEELRALRAKREHSWSPDDIDWIFFKAATTIGSEETVKFAFVRLAEILLREANEDAASATIIPTRAAKANGAHQPLGSRRWHAMHAVGDQARGVKYLHVRAR